MITPGYLASFAVVYGFIVLAHGLAWFYFRNWQITRPPVGVMNLGDVVFMLVGVVLVPYLYLVLPRGVIIGLLLTSIASLLYLLWEPVLRAAWAIWLVTLLMTAADGGAALLFGTQSSVFLGVNNCVQVAAAVGVAVLWTQSGMKARDAVILGALLGVYDYIFTARLPLMQDLITRFTGLPYAPELAWSWGTTSTWLSIGLGDLMLAVVFPLVMRKAYGRRAGLTALVISFGALAVVMLAPYAGFFTEEVFPLMVVLGPLMILQFVFWRWKRGVERTTWQYQQAEP